MLAARRQVVVFAALSAHLLCACAPEPKVAASPVVVPPSPWPGVSLPSAENALDMNDAPVIVVDTRSVTLDDEVVADLGDLVAARRVHRLDRLFERLKQKREAWRAAHPGQALTGECNLVIDERTTAAVVKSVFQTAAFAGYPALSFVVRRSSSRGAIGRLPADAQVPGPGMLNGKLPPEGIQRIVRRSFGPMRKCYEQALVRDAQATGRVVTKFVIERDGHVSHAAAIEPAGSKVPPLRDEQAVACIVGLFGTLVFPVPEGGSVTVVYPIDFSPSD